MFQIQGLLSIVWLLKNVMVNINGRVLPKCNSEKLHKFCLIELSKHGYWLFKSYSFPVKETVNFNRGVGTLNAIMH